MSLITRFLHNTSFRQQMVATVSVGVMAVALASSLAISWQGSRQIRDTLVKQGERVADNLALQSKLALLYDSAENVAAGVNLTLAFPDVTGIEVLRANGQPLLVKMKSETTPAIAGPVNPLQRDQAHLAGESADSWHFVAPVFTDAQDSPFEMKRKERELLGHVRIVQSKATLTRMMRDVFALNFFMSFLFALLFMVALRFFADRLTRPLTSLSEAMGKAERGESGIRADLAGPQDIAHMAHAFNSMMTVLEEREAELRKARDDAVKFARLKAEFAATVSHEIRTPLNGVVGTLDMLMASSLPPRQRQFVEIAWESAQYLLDLINNILDFSRLEAGKLELKKSVFDLRTLVEEVIDLIAQQAHQKGLEVGYLIAPDVPQRVVGDQTAVRQVLVNLVGNAVKFTYSGEIAIRITLTGPQETDLRFEVADTGIGIAEGARAVIFDSFTQVDTTTTRRYGGSGLGLAICKQLVTLMGGSLGVHSEPDKGSKFHFTLPLEIRALERSAGGRLAPPAAKGIAARGIPVLVVEESAIARHFLEQSLNSWGYQCRTSRGADEALIAVHTAAAQGAPYRVVIMDAVFATAAGGQLLARLRADALAKQSRIIVMNRYGAEAAPPARQGEADAYLSKPLRLERVLECIAQATGVEAAAEPTTTSTAEERVPDILVVEDNRTNQAIAEGMLGMLRCHAEIAADGSQALHAFKRRKWDLILMDCNMPDMDGYQVTAAIRALEAEGGGRTPIVAMTANTQPSDIEKCLAAGMDDHLPKPLTLGSVSAKLKRWLPDQAVKLPDAESASGATAGADAARGPETLDAGVMLKLREALGDAVGQAIRPFLEDMPSYLEEMEQAVAAGEPERLRRTVHAVKGAGGNLGATALATVARDIEARAEDGELTGVGELLAKLRAEYTLVRQELVRELKADLEQPPENVSEGALVLLVDDDRSTRAALRYALQRGGFRIEEAADGAQALALLDRIDPDVILMDALMPVMDGFTACAKLQEMPAGKNIPVLMITALEDNHSIERAFAAGASDYIPKPIHLAVVNQRVKRVVEATRAQRHVRHLAYNDTLTGLPNRAMFTDYLNRFIKRASESGQALAVLFLDLDRFKFVNDTLGHEIGDRLLKSVARRLKHCVRSNDCVARLGGDEFTIILDDLPNSGIAANTAQKVCRALSTPFEIDSHDIFVSASIGISLFPGDGNDVSTLLRHADTAMYRAKNNNSGYEFYEAGMEASVSEHLRMENALRRALERDELVAHFQPVADARTGQITGAEALVRWRHPTRGLVMPGEFIPLAEETGLIGPIGEWVLRTTCLQAKRWLDAGIGDMRFAVNISGGQLRQGRFAEIVQGALADAKLSPRHLTLEITESVIMEHARETVAVLRQLKEIGVNLAIDDFGTGYSSLSYLKRFPVDTLKIDYSFTRDITQKADDASIVSGIIALAHSLRLKVVAEGVENEAQRAFLIREGCDYIQGYYLSEPLPPEEFQRKILAPQFPDAFIARP
jgi:diguanylate cyclase (GGDEF)-like protein